MKFNDKSFFMITIDGPAGSGKSTTARLVAQKLGFTYLDTGAMYRALTFQAIEGNKDLYNGPELAKLAHETDYELATNSSLTRIWVNGQEVTNEIRSPRVTKNVSAVARHPEVRTEMVRLQRKIASKDNFVVEGRDIGTVVFPDADLKIYMNASINARARRRLLELKEKGIEVSFEQVKKEIIKRDEIDSRRRVAPMQKPGDAIEIDTTNLTINGQVNKIIEAYKCIKK